MGDILCEQQEGVVIVTIASPSTRNALTREMNVKLVELCDWVVASEELGAVVLRGAGGTFCSGTDRTEWDRYEVGSTENFERLDLVYTMLQRVGSLPVPVVAAVRGSAVGAGLNLALAADMRIVSPRARLMSGFARAGLHPGGGFFVLVGRSGKRDVAAALGLFDIELSGIDAVDRGLAFEVAADEEVERRAIERARVAAADPELIRAVTKSFRTQLGPPLVTWAGAVEADRGRQMWSHQRRAITETRVSRVRGSLQATSKSED